MMGVAAVHSRRCSSAAPTAVFSGASSGGQLAGHTHTDAALHQILALMNEEGALYCKGSGPRAWSVF